MKTASAVIVLALGALVSHAAAATEVSVPMFEVHAGGLGPQLGAVVIQESPNGLRFDAKMAHLSPGPHGFHVHEGDTCSPSVANGKPVPAGAAGGHWDPDGTHTHAGPQGNGHRGDLPPLTADQSGMLHEQVLAPHIGKLADLHGHVLMIHAGGDNFSDHPSPLGGGGVRVACGIIP